MTPPERSVPLEDELNPRTLTHEEIAAIDALRVVQPPAISDLHTLCWMARAYLRENRP